MPTISAATVDLTGRLTAVLHHFVAAEGTIDPYTALGGRPAQRAQHSSTIPTTASLWNLRSGAEAVGDARCITAKSRNGTGQRCR
jgi:hypothetical protein